MKKFISIILLLLVASTIGLAEGTHIYDNAQILDYPDKGIKVSYFEMSSEDFTFDDMVDYYYNFVLADSSITYHIILFTDQVLYDTYTFAEHKAGVYANSACVEYCTALDPNNYLPGLYTTNPQAETVDYFPIDGTLKTWLECKSN